MEVHTSEQAPELTQPRRQDRPGSGHALRTSARKQYPLSANAVLLVSVATGKVVTALQDEKLERENGDLFSK